jgi:hypothetical protein
LRSPIGYLSHALFRRCFLRINAGLLLVALVVPGGASAESSASSPSDSLVRGCPLSFSCGISPEAESKAKGHSQGSPAIANTHPVEVAGQDDDAIVDNLRNRRLLALRLYAGLKVKYIRMNLRTKDFGGNLQKYFDAIAQARALGMSTELTIEKPLIRFRMRDWRRYLHRVLASFGRRVQRISIFNEPNYPSDYVRPQRYRQLYAVAYSLIKQHEPQIQVLLGELAPVDRQHFVSYLQTVLCLDAHDHALSRRCHPLRTDGIAVHSYQFGVPPKRRSPRYFGIGDLSQLRHAVRRAVASRMLQVPGNNNPSLFLTEFGYGAPEGAWSVANRQRGDWMEQAYSIACHTPGVRQLLTYQLFPSANGAAWDSSIVDRHGQPTAVYSMMQRWITDHSDCVDPPAAAIPNSS